MFAYERREDLDNLDKRVMSHLTEVEPFRTDYFTLLEWCRIGTDVCACNGAGNDCQLEVLDEGSAHMGYLASSPVDRRWLEFALSPYWVLDPEEVDVWPGRRHPQHVPHVIRGERWTVCVGVVRGDRDDALVFNHLENP